MPYLYYMLQGGYIVLHLIQHGIIHCREHTPLLEIKWTLWVFLLIDWLFGGRNWHYDYPCQVQELTCND
jgi:hypothetical protein